MTAAMKAPTTTLAAWRKRRCAPIKRRLESAKVHQHRPGYSLLNLQLLALRLGSRYLLQLTRSMPLIE